MKKENRPGQQAANIDIRGSDVTPPAPTTQAPRRTPKKHRARVYMLRTGVEGWTENDILRYCRLSSGRNYASELERRLDIQLERIDEKNPDGIGSHLRYRFTGRGRVPFLTQRSIVGMETPKSSGIRKRRMYPVVGSADCAA